MTARPEVMQRLEAFQHRVLKAVNAADGKQGGHPPLPLLQLTVPRTLLLPRACCLALTLGAKVLTSARRLSSLQS